MAVIGTQTPILRDPQLQEALLRDGLAITRLFTDAQIEGLKLIVEKLEADADHNDMHIQTPFYLSAFHNDGGWKKRIFDEIHAYTKDIVEGLLVDYEPLVINIHDKPPGPKTHLGIHQNPSFVMEPGHKSVTIWIPMIDTHRGNGGLGVLPGSHDVFDAERAANMPDVFEDIAHQLTEQYFDAIEVKKGEAVILDDSLIHWSYANMSNVPRMAVQLIMVPKEPHHIYSYYNTSGPTPRMDRYTVDKNFFFQFNCKAEPEGLPYLDSIDYEYNKVTEAELLARVSPRNPGILAKRKT